VLEAKRNRQSRGITRRRPFRQSESEKQLAATKRKRCSKKKRYGTKEEAAAQCERMLARVPLQLTPLEAYFCYRHQAWHIGHNWLRYNTERRQEW